MGLLLLEAVLDVLSLFFVMFLVAGQEQAKSRRGALQWVVVIFAFLIINQMAFTTDGNNIHAIFERGFEFFPVEGLVGVTGLLFITLLMNSFFLKASHIEIIFVTMFGFIIWFLLRMLAVVIIDFLSIGQWVVSVITFVLAGVTYGFVKKKLSTYLQRDFSSFVKLMIVSVFSFLLYIILTAGNQQSLIIQPVIILFMIMVLFIVIGWLLYEQRRTQVMETRMQVIEEYIPIIDELVVEVRSRQHEFSNKLMAISSILHTAERIEDAERQVAQYVENVQLTSGQYELLNMDHKVVAGFLYTKMKRIEQLNMKLEIDRTVAVSAFPCEDYDLIEVLGILIDNAMEACFGGDTIIIRMNHKENHYELTVSNPADYLTNEQFLKLFQFGYSTKSTYTNKRGFGLYNVQQIAKQYNGKIIARNEQQENMITIGIQF